MDASIAFAWEQAKLGRPFQAPNCSPEELRRALLPGRHEILRHFMARPGCTLEHLSFLTGCPVLRLQELVDELFSAGFLVQGLFGLTAAPDLRAENLPRE